MQHLAILRVVNWLIAGLTFLGGVLFLLLYLLPWLIDDPEVPGWAFAVIGVVGFLVFAAFAAAHVVLGYLVGTGRARIAQTALALAQILSFPFGTFYAVYALWVCWVNPESVARFESAYKPPVA